MSNLTSIKQKEIYTKHLTAELATANDKIKKLMRGSLGLPKQSPASIQFKKLNSSFNQNPPVPGENKRKPSANPPKKTTLLKGDGRTPTINHVDLATNFPQIKQTRNQSIA